MGYHSHPQSQTALPGVMPCYMDTVTIAAWDFNLPMANTSMAK